MRHKSGLSGPDAFLVGSPGVVVDHRAAVCGLLKHLAEAIMDEPSGFSVLLPVCCIFSKLCRDFGWILMKKLLHAELARKSSLSPEAWPSGED